MKLLTPLLRIIQPEKNIILKKQLNLDWKFLNLTKQILQQEKLF